MGEMERLKEFGFKGSKAEYDRVGGDLYKMKSINGKTLQQMYKGGAEKLSKSGSGLISTITGSLKSGLQDAGLGLVDRLKPELESMIPAIQEFSERLPNMLDRVTPVFVSLFNAGKSVGSVFGVLFESSGFLISGFKILGGAIEGLAGIISWTIKKIGGVVNFLNNISFGYGSGPQGLAKDSGNKPNQRFNIFGHATGTKYFGGGLTKINERGEELIKLPTGSKIYPAGETSDIIAREMKGSNASNSNNINITMNISTGGDIDEDKLAEILYRRISEVVLA